MEEAPSTLAQGCIRYVKEATGIELDYTQDTLPLLDHYLRTVEGGERDDVLRLVVPVCGAYLGEMLLREFPDCRWGNLGAETNQVRIEFSRCFLHFNPMGMVLEAILGHQAPGWRAHLGMFDGDKEAVEAALSHLGEIDSEDYYRASIRYEVLETTHSVLLARANKTQSFSPDVYKAAIRADDEEAEAAT